MLFFVLFTYECHWTNLQPIFHGIISDGPAVKAVVVFVVVGIEKGGLNSDNNKGYYTLEEGWLYEYLYMPRGIIKCISRFLWNQYLKHLTCAI